jgi:hypothetical protein
MVLRDMYGAGNAQQGSGLREGVCVCVVWWWLGQGGRGWLCGWRELCVWWADQGYICVCVAEGVCVVWWWPGQGGRGWLCGCVQVCVWLVHKAVAMWQAEGQGQGEVPSL